MFDPKCDFALYRKSASSFEVSTPFNVADIIVSGIRDDILRNPDSTYLCVASKDGKIVRTLACTLMASLEDAIPDSSERLRHIFHKQIYITCTSLNAVRLTCSTAYLYSNASSENFAFRFDNMDGNARYIEDLKKDKKYNGNIKKLLKEVFSVDYFDAVIGNPPYNEMPSADQVNTTSKAAFANYLVNGIDLKPKQLIMAVPSKVKTSQKYDNLRKKISNGGHVFQYDDYLDAKELFPSEIQLKGGVGILNWQRDYDGKTRYVVHQNGKIVSDEVKQLVNPSCGVVLKVAGADSVVEKILSFNEDSFSSIVSSMNPFGLSTNFANLKSEPFNGCIKVNANYERTGYVNINSITRNVEAALKEHKIFINKAIGIGSMQTDKIKPIHGEPGTAATASFLMVGPFKNEAERINAAKYIETKFFHFLVGLLKGTHDCYRYVFKLAPMQDFSIEWTDKMLYEKYKLTEAEIALIESSVWN